MHSFFPRLPLCSRSKTMEIVDNVHRFLKKPLPTEVHISNCEPLYAYYRLLEAYARQDEATVDMEEAQVPLQMQYMLTSGRSPGGMYRMAQGIYKSEEDDYAGDQ